MLDAPTDSGEECLLIVDDDPLILSSLLRLFRREPYRLLKAEGGHAGLALLAEQPVGVIISDQRMPDMNGVEFLSRVRERWPDTVRIVLSGYTELSSVTEVVNQGAIYKFLTKPWDEADLRQTVREAFQLYRVASENTRLNGQLRQANETLSRWNQELEQRVADETHESLRNLQALRVSQEILANLPLAVLGIDPDGTIVMANREAESLLDGGASLLGEIAEEVLSRELVEAGSAEGGAGEPAAGVLRDGRHVGLWRFPLGSASLALGSALVVVPRSQA